MTAKKLEEFDEDLFETRLEGLKDTQDGIQQMSSWCLEKRPHHKKIVQCWLNVFKKSRVEQRLVLFYLANDVIQYSKRKRFEFVESWATALQRATTMVRDEKVKNKILRIFKIWAEREIYTEDFLSDLQGLLNIPVPKKAAESVDVATDEFSSAKLIAYIKECVQNADATDKSMKKVPKMPNADAETLKQQLKDKTHTEDCEKDLDRYITYMKVYYKNLQAELKTRRDLITEIANARKFYHGQLDEVKVVAAAYKNFGLRIRNLQKKLNELTPNLPSPMPSPDINAPSPEPDTDLQLPDDQTPISVNFFKNSMNGYSGYLDGTLPFDINDFKSEDSHGNSRTTSQPIEVIGGRSDDESYSSNSNVDFYKPLSGFSSNSNIPIPGLSNSINQPLQSEYTSLARSSAQYGNVLAGTPNPQSVFDGTSYSTLMSAYNNEQNSYNPNTRMSNQNTAIMQSAQHIPPPPMPPAALTSALDNSTTSPNNWNMSWNTGALASTSNSKIASSNVYNPNLSVIETPVSPPRFEREPLNSALAPLEYNERDNPLTQGSDVDHRELHLTPFSITPKLDLNTADKMRSLDIDHRNLISLTGSPHISDGDKKTWTGLQSTSGDIDYRATVLQRFKSIAAIPMPSALGSKQSDASTISSPKGMMPPPVGSASNTTSPPKSYASSSSESQKEDLAGRYDPTDMVIDMDMSDEDLDDILREVEDQKQQALIQAGEMYTQPVMPPRMLPAVLDDSLTSAMFAPTSNENGGSNTKSTPLKTPLLETPPEFAAPPPPLPPPQSIWDSPNMMNMQPGYAHQGPRIPFSPDHHQQQQQQQFQPITRGNGRGRGWSPHAMNSPYRTQRPMRGGGGRGGGNGNSGGFGNNSPFFNRGGGGYRGRRGGNNNNAWI